MGKPASKLFSPFRSSWPPRPGSACSSGAASKPGCASTKRSSGPGTRWRSEEGAFLVYLLLAAGLACLVFLGSVKLVLLSQRKVALQSRLDICAVKRATMREQLYRSLARSNFYLQGTVYGIYAARGLRLIPIPGIMVFGAVSERALLATNRALSGWQEMQVESTQVAELAGVRCERTPFSEQAAFCAMTPVLKRALKRKKPWFPDIRGVYVLQGKKLGSVTCLASLTMRTTLEIRGDPELWESKYEDAYKK